MAHPDGCRGSCAPWDSADRLGRRGACRMVSGPPTSTSPSGVVIDRAVRVFGWSGVALPEMMLIGCRLIPVVHMDPEAHRARVRSGDGPQLDVDVLAMWEWQQSAGHVPPSVLRLSGVLVVARRGWLRALRQARSMRGFGPAGVLAAPQAADDEECRLEFALHGIGLASSDPVLDRVVAPEQGRGGSARRCAADRWIEESLYQHALDRGLT